MSLLFPLWQSFPDISQVGESVPLGSPGIIVYYQAKHSVYSSKTCGSDGHTNEYVECHKENGISCIELSTTHNVYQVVTK
jgi:hypothetical protein